MSGNEPIERIALTVAYYGPQVAIAHSRVTVEREDKYILKQCERRLFRRCTTF